jgi:hypothetical protein
VLGMLKAAYRRRQEKVSGFWGVRLCALERCGAGGGGLLLGVSSACRPPLAAAVTK